MLELGIWCLLIPSNSSVWRRRSSALHLPSPASIDTMRRNRFHSGVKVVLRTIGLLLIASRFLTAAEEPELLAKVTPLPVALDPDFQFRKTKLYALKEKGPEVKQKVTKKGEQGSSTTTSSKSTNVVQEASITFE